jgi:hypothetical protein
MITTTLDRLAARQTWQPMDELLLDELLLTSFPGGPDDPLPLARIVEIYDVDALGWCCCAEPQYAKEWLQFGIWCARQVEHLFLDPACGAALDAAERYAKGGADENELLRQRRAAWSAARGINKKETLRTSAALAVAFAMEASWEAKWVLAIDGDKPAKHLRSFRLWKFLMRTATEAQLADGTPSMRERQTAELLRIVTETEARSP